MQIVCDSEVNNFIIAVIPMCHFDLRQINVDGDDVFTSYQKYFVLHLGLVANQLV